MRLSALLPALCFGLAMAGALVGGIAAPAGAAGDEPAYGPELQGFDYPWPVSHFSFTSQGEALRHGVYGRETGDAANGETVVLFHGKNFCAATWQETDRGR